jgi:hypothetical protein
MPAVEMAQYTLHIRELVVRAPIELFSEPNARCSPRLGELLRRTALAIPARRANCADSALGLT